MDENVSLVTCEAKHEAINRELSSMRAWTGGMDERIRGVESNMAEFKGEVRGAARVGALIGGSISGLLMIVVYVILQAMGVKS